MHSGADDKLHSPSAASAAGRHPPPGPDSDYRSDDDDDNDGPSRPGKRKRFVSVSCEICKQRKVKCDRGQPACGWCTRNGAVCEYKERKRPGLRAGFGKELQERMDRLEAILKSHSEILQSSLLSASHGAPASAARNGLPGLAGDHGTPRVRKPSEPVGTPQADGGLYLRKPSTLTSVSQSSDFGPSSAPPGHDSFRSQMPTPRASSPPLHLPPIQMTPQEYCRPDRPGAHSSSGWPQAAAGPAADQVMPPYDLVYSLVDLYFKHINTWCPILHRKTTLDLLFGPSASHESDRVLLHAIVATTMRYSTDPRLTEERREHYYRVSKERVLLYGIENASVESLQALVILALDFCGNRNGPPGWNIMALITRSVVQLGLAVESNSLSVAPSFTSIYTLRAMILAEPKDFVEEESRRRLFWMVYLLDRYATIATAFEFALPDKEIDRRLPCRDDLWLSNQKVETRLFQTGDSAGSAAEHEVGRPQDLGAFSYYIEVLGILSKIHVFLKQPVDIGAPSDVDKWKRRYKELDNMLALWKYGLLGEFGDLGRLFQPGAARNVSCTWVMLHATYHTTVIRLHSSAAYPTTRSSVFLPSFSAGQRCLGAVENIATLAEFVVNAGLLAKLGPPFAFTLWVCARLLLVHGCTVERTLSPRISFFVDTLRDMGRHWPVAARYCGLLQRVLDEHGENERTGVVPHSVRILSDMRRTAFDLDLLISRQPRQSASGVGRLANKAPSKTPAANDLEYLDVFDFFNYPRLLFGGDDGDDAAVEAQNGGDVGPLNEFNITNFIVDANSDWLFKQEESKYTGEPMAQPKKDRCS